MLKKLKKTPWRKKLQKGVFSPAYEGVLFLKAPPEYIKTGMNNR